MNRNFLYILLFILLGACGKTWNLNGASMDQFDTDSARCKNTAYDYISKTTPEGVDRLKERLSEGSMYDVKYKSCMRQRGYTPAD